MTSIDLDKCDLLLLGDINVNMLPHSKGSVKKDKQQLLNFSRTLDLSQLIKEPTRVTEKFRTLIDLVLVNNEHRIVDSGVIPVPLSDYYTSFTLYWEQVWPRPHPEPSNIDRTNILTPTLLRKISRAFLGI